MSVEPQAATLSTDPPSAIPGPSVGRIVHVRAQDGSCRAALVVRHWGDSAHPKWDDAVNLTVFWDWSNDDAYPPHPNGGTSWVTWVTSSKHESLAPNGGALSQYWHWPERA